MERNYLIEEAAVEMMRRTAENANVCMLISYDIENKACKRPIDAVKIDDDGNLWFFASRSSGKLKDIAVNNKVSIVYANPDVDMFLEVQGVCQVNCDREAIISKWCPMVTKWFPGGFSDPEVCLVKMETNLLFYWNEKQERVMPMALKSTYDIESLAA